MTLKKYKDKYVILWPQYFDSTLSRKEGRKLPKELCIPKPTQRELIEAVSALGLSSQPLDGRYPREWWNREGPVLVEKKWNKRKIMYEVAKILKKNRYES